MSTTSTTAHAIHVESDSEAPPSGRPTNLPLGPLVGMLVGLVIGFGPMLFLHFSKLWARAEYQHFPFVLAAIGYLAWTCWQQRACQSEARTGTMTIVTAVAAWLVLATAVFLYEPWFAAAAAILLAAALIGHLGSTHYIPGIWFVWCLGWLLVPLRLLFDTRLTVNLQALSSSFSSQVLDLIGVNHLMRGNVMEIPGRELFVDEACSGIISVMSVVACAAIYGVWNKRGGLHLVLLVASGIGWAIAMNIGRICAIATAQDKQGWDLSSGTAHEMLGLALFCLTFIATISTDQMLAFVLYPIEIEDIQRDRYLRNPIIRLFNWFASLGMPRPISQATGQAIGARWPTTAMFAVGGAFGVLGATHFAVWGSDSVNPKSGIASASAIDQQTLPAQKNLWKTTGFEDIHREENDNTAGEYSKTWTYKSDTGKIITVSFDYPFSGSWHDLPMCYELSGWTQTQRQVKSADSSGGDWNYVESDFEDISGKRGFLVFSIFDRGGEPTSPPAAQAYERVWRRLRRRGPKEAWPQMYQFQVWAESGDEFSDEVKEEIRQLLFEFRDKVRASFLNNLAK